MTNLMISKYSYDVNMSCICNGIGKGLLKHFVLLRIYLTFSSIKISKTQKNLLPELSAVANNSMIQAISETVAENDGNTDISAAFDFTWKKTGHSSLNGVVCATSLINR